MTRKNFVIVCLTLALTVLASAQIPESAADGNLDPTFGVAGRVKYEDSSGYPLGAGASALQSDGKIIVAGLIGVSPNGSDFALVRFKPDGSLDTAFGTGGKVTTNFSQGDAARAIAIQPDGKIVVAGSGETLDERGYSLSTSFELARYNNTGLQIVSAVHFDPPSIDVGGSWNVRLSGSNLTDRTYFDVHFRSPGSTTDQVALNWQQGTSSPHIVPAGTEAGTWIITGIRAHESVNDHDGEFMPVSAFLSVTGNL